MKMCIHCLFDLASAIQIVVIPWIRNVYIMQITYRWLQITHAHYANIYQFLVFLPLYTLEG